jgi:hypothetical protein
VLIRLQQAEHSKQQPLPTFGQLLPKHLNRHLRFVFSSSSTIVIFHKFHPFFCVFKQVPVNVGPAAQPQPPIPPFIPPPPFTFPFPIPPHVPPPTSSSGNSAQVEGAAGGAAVPPPMMPPPFSFPPLIPFSKFRFILPFNFLLT